VTPVLSVFLISVVTDLSIVTPVLSVFLISVVTDLSIVLSFSENELLALILFVDLCSYLYIPFLQITLFLIDFI
jgi:hypothetical protein